MKSKEIKVGHLYYVDYNPVKPYEFQGKHLAFVLKKNYDKVTYVTVPLTSKEKSEKTNLFLGKISTLPDVLGEVDSYAVIDQVRTVNSARFSPVLKNGEIIDVVMPKELKTKIINAVAKDMFRDFNVKISIEEINTES